MIVRDSLFLSDPWGHGGCKRSAQISEILHANQIESVFLDEIIALKNTGKIKKIINSFKLLRRLPFRVKYDLSTLYKFGHEYAYSQFFKTLDKPSVILWENNYCFRSPIIPFLAQQSGVPIIAIPHNLESLVPNQLSYLSNKMSPLWLNEELACLACCDHVFAISREEQWLLRLHGIDADFLPYYPPSAVMPCFSQIRAEREKLTDKRDFLMLGSACNPPTMLGMSNRIRFFKKQCGLNEILHVVGLDTELLKGEAGGASNIIIHGKMDQYQLNHLLTRIKAVLIHQSPTSGAVTRIPEMICAGVPIIADTNSLRTWNGMDGLYTYEDDEELRLLLKRDLEMPNLPPKPLSYENRFVETVRNCSRN